MIKFRTLLIPTFIVVIVCLVYVSGVFITSDGDPMAFALLGTRFSESDPQGTVGYDGQFAYQIALDPAGAAPYIDVPAYRYQRILYPVLARLLAFGQPALIPWTLILVNVAAIGIGTWATGLLLIDFRVSRGYALAYGLYGGQLLALRTDLNEPLAQALVMLAILAWARERRIWAIVAFSLAALAKETALIFLVAYILYTLTKRQWHWAVGLGMAAVPFGAYQLLLWRWLGDFGVGSGGAGATPFSLIPLGGWLTIATIHFGAFLLISLIVVPMSIFPSLVGSWLSVRRLWTGEVHPLIYCLLLNSLVILFLPASTFREPAAMLRLTQGLVVSMLLYGGLNRSRRILNNSTLWIATNVLLLKGVAMI
ncbi:AZOBR_p60025 family cell surface glycopolymer formation protein [Chloroflexota bacterium]